MLSLSTKRTALFSFQSDAECSRRQHPDLDESLAYLRMTGLRLSDQLRVKTTRAINKPLQVLTERQLRSSIFSVKQ